MAGASSQDEEVPHFVEPEDSRNRVGALEPVDERACAINQAPAQHPGDTARRHRPKEGGGRDHGDPAHAKVEHYREPARGVHPENFEEDAAQREAPDKAEQSPSPSAVKGEQAEGGIGPRYENEDSHVIQPSQPRHPGWRERQKVVESARGVGRPGSDRRRRRLRSDPASPRAPPSPAARWAPRPRASPPPRG